MNENKEYYKFNNQKIENNNDKPDNKINMIYKFKLGLYIVLYFLFYYQIKTHIKF